jgi:hypothetical protein
MKLKYTRYLCKKWVIIFFVLFFLWPEIYLLAGENEDPFSSIKLEAKVSHNLNHNLIDTYWNSANGTEFLVEVPFYTGNIQAGFLLQKFNGKENVYPSFTGNILFISMVGEINLPLKFELSGGVKAGYFLMSYDSNTLTAYEKFESELTAGVTFRLSYPVTNSIYISIASDLLVLMTHEQMKFYNISAGVAYKFNSPQWIKDLLN